MLTKMPDNFNSLLAINAREVEYCLLGAFLLDEKLIDEIPDSFGAEHFSLPLYGRIYSAMVALHDKGKAVDPFTISAELNSDEEFQAVGGPKFCVDLINATVGCNIKEYIDIIIDFYLRREVKKISTEMNYEAENKFGDTEAIDIIDKSEQQLYNLSNKHLRPQPTCRAMMAKMAPSNASMAPSATNGPRIKLFEAPTRRMMAISRRRAEMARRMVLLINTKATKMSSTMSTAAPMRM